MYCDFVTCCMDQIWNQAGKINLMSGGEFQVPMVIKTPPAGRARAGTTRRAWRRGSWRRRG